MTQDPILQQLRKDLSGDFKPVRPLATPWLRSFWLIPIWLLILGVVLVVFGLRPDYPVLGPTASWGLSFVQLLACFVVFYAMLTATIPGGSKAPSVLASIGLLGIAVHIGASWISFQISPNLAEPGHELRDGLACLSAITTLALLPLAFGIFWLRAGLPIRAKTAGILLGLGSGLAAEAAWRLHCPISSWDHVIPFHSGAILIASGLGLLFGLQLLGKHHTGLNN